PPLPFVSALAKKVESEKPDLVLLGATLNGRDLGARLAARLGRAYAADVTGLRAAGNALELDKPMYAGKVRAKVRLDLAAVVSVRAGAVPLTGAGEAPQGEKIEADGSVEKLTFVKLAATATGTRRVSLSEAPDADIFKIADYGIVADVFEFVPAFTEAVKKARA